MTRPHTLDSNNSLSLCHGPSHVFPSLSLENSKRTACRVFNHLSSEFFGTQINGKNSLCMWYSDARIFRSQKNHFF